MANILTKVKGFFEGGKAEEEYPEEFTEDYVQLETERKEGPKGKIIVRPFMLDDFGDIKPILDALRDGYTIALVNIRPIKDKDIVELKRVVNKLKKTCDAIDGDIAGFGEDWLVVTPNFARIHRNEDVSPSTTIIEE